MPQIIAKNYAKERKIRLNRDLALNCPGILLPWHFEHLNGVAEAFDADRRQLDTGGREGRGLAQQGSISPFANQDSPPA
jgi:hypothetical protein